MIRVTILLSALAVLFTSPVLAVEDTWKDEMARVPVQDDGRVMPLETYARSIARQLTGRTKWSEDRGPEGYAGREPVELFCDLMFRPDELMHTELIAVENRPFKRVVGLDPMRRFFTPTEIWNCQGINEQLHAFSALRAEDPSAQPLANQKIALDLRGAVDQISNFAARTPIAIVPGPPGEPFLSVSPTSGDPGTESVQQALAAFGEQYRAGTPSLEQARAVSAAIVAVNPLTKGEARGIELELFYDSHAPWRKCAVAYGLAIIVFGLSRLFLRKPLVILAVLLGVWGFAEQVLGLSLRVGILDRAPVTNTFESLIWMGVVAAVLGLIAQILDRKSYYLFGGVCAAFISVLFAGLVPLHDQTNALPAVLRSNFWLIIHVLTIVASYGVLAVAAVLGHAYLFKRVILAKKATPQEQKPGHSHPLIVQTYRTIQIGLILLTTGTILGGVWAADSWGRFWGWDPKETWSLISIIVYFAMLHARYVGWLKDFGLAASAVLGMVVIVWTFYGVNYVMATGLHSYGFGSGGEVWVALWAIFEVVFLVVAKVRYTAIKKHEQTLIIDDTPTPPAPPAGTEPA